MKKQYMLLAINAEGNSVYIDDVPNGAKCNCHCADCGGELIAKNNGKIKHHHFAHANGNDSPKCSQTALHLLAKKVIAEEKRIPIFSNGNIEFANVDFVEQEKNLGDIKPDLYAEHNGAPIAIEIFVSHAVDGIKFNKIQEHKLTTFEINLSQLNYETKDDVKNAIYDLKNIKLIYDNNIVQEYLENKRTFILTTGIRKRIRNGIIRNCHMCALFVNGRFSKWRDVPAKICQNCFFGFKENTFVYCIDNLDGEIPIWFLQANINENRFMNKNETQEKLKQFICTLRNKAL